MELAQGPTPGEAGYQHPSPGGGDKETLGPGDTSRHAQEAQWLDAEVAAVGDRRGGRNDEVLREEGRLPGVMEGGGVEFVLFLCLNTFFITYTCKLIQ